MGYFVLVESLHGIHGLFEQFLDLQFSVRPEITVMVQKQFTQIFPIHLFNHDVVAVFILNMVVELKDILVFDS